MDQAIYDHRYFKKMRAGENLSKADNDRFFEGFVKLAAIQTPDTSILDVGCGRGDLLAYFAKSGANNVFGCDFSPAAVELTRERLAPFLGESTAQKNILLGSATDRNLFAGGTFDRIFLTDVVEHLPQRDLELALANIRHWLKPDGTAIIHTFPTAGIHQLFRRYLKLRGDHSALGKLDAIHCNVQTVRHFKENIENAELTSTKLWLQNDFVLSSSVFQGMHAGIRKRVLAFFFERILSQPLIRSLVRICGMSESVYPSIYCICTRNAINLEEEAKNA